MDNYKHTFSPTNECLTCLNDGMKLMSEHQRSFCEVPLK